MAPPDQPADQQPTPIPRSLALPRPSNPPTRVPQRAIRAHIPSPGHIVVYQAYSRSIGAAAVGTQSLLAAADFQRARTTWIKPSWCWMMYRSGYGAKDARQACVLALTMRAEDLWGLLGRAVVSGHGHEEEKRKRRWERGREVVVQWDPERGPRLERLACRSLQVGVPPVLVEEWAGGMVVGIEDVTERARGLKEALDGDVEGVLRWEDLVTKGLVPVEEELVVPDDVRVRLGMD